MTRKTRLILFLLLMALFLIAAPLTVFYSLGWRIDWEAKKITKPGIFYFKVRPKSAEIYLNGKLEEKTDMFFGSAFIENLFPKKYEVEIRKRNFHSWKKVLEIKKGEVAEAKNIILFPENPLFKISSENAENILIPKESAIDADTASVYKNYENIIDFSTFKIEFSPDLKKIAYYNDYEIWILFLEDKFDQPPKKAKDQIFLTRFSEKIGRVFWLTDHYLIFNAGNSIKISEIDDRDEINIITLTEKFPEPEIFWNIKTKKLYVLSEKSLYVLEKLIP